MTDREAVADWVARYERAWRSPGTAGLDGLFTPAISYRPSPWAQPIVGLVEVRRFWEASRDEPDERFRLASEVVAVDGSVGVVRVAVDYDDGESWRDLWVLGLDDHGRCDRFEEWPFRPDQPDGHEGDRP